MASTALDFDRTLTVSWREPTDEKLEYDGHTVCDIIPLPGEAPWVLVSSTDGFLAVVNVELGEIVEPIRPVTKGATAVRVAAVTDDRVVLWGWEDVVALARDGGGELWVISDGDHSLDGDDGVCAQSTGDPFALFPNGGMLEILSGTPAPIEAQPGFDCDKIQQCCSHPHRGFVCSVGANVWRWNLSREGPPLALIGSFAIEVRGLSADRGTVRAALGDGSVWQITDTQPTRLSPALVDPTVVGLYYASLAVSPSGRRLVLQYLAFYQQTATSPQQERACFVVIDLAGSSQPTLLLEVPGRQNRTLLPPCFLTDDALVIGTYASVHVFERAEDKWVDVQRLELLGARTIAVHRNALLLGEMGRLRIVPIVGGEGVKRPDQLPASAHGPREA